MQVGIWCVKPNVAKDLVGRSRLPVHEVVSKIQVLLQLWHGPVVLEVATPIGQQMLEG